MIICTCYKYLTYLCMYVYACVWNILLYTYSMHNAFKNWYIHTHIFFMEQFSFCPNVYHDLRVRLRMLMAYCEITKYTHMSFWHHRRRRMDTIWVACDIHIHGGPMRRSDMPCNICFYCTKLYCWESNGNREIFLSNREYK